MRSTANRFGSIDVVILLSICGSSGCTPEPVVLFEIPIAGCSEGVGCLDDAAAGSEGVNKDRKGELGGGPRAEGAGGLRDARTGGAPGMGGSDPQSDAGESGCADPEDCEARGEEASNPHLPCTDHSDCPVGLFCLKDRCGDPSGQCSARPFGCDEESRQEVCGCDDVTYWNDCVRKLSGQTSSTPGECSTQARVCKSHDDCGGGYCARLVALNGPCTDRVQGTCWVLPSTCPSSTDNTASRSTPKFVPCDTAWEGKDWSRGCPPPIEMAGHLFDAGEGPDGGFFGTGTLRYTGLCEAIQSGRPYHQISADQCFSRP